jgi:hypothetical protein
MPKAPSAKSQSLRKKCYFGNHPHSLSAGPGFNVSFSPDNNGTALIAVLSRALKVQQHCGDLS